MNVINHGKFHVSSDSDAQKFLNVMGSGPGDTGHNGFGRAPLTDCTGELDSAGHALGGPWRFAVYAQHEVATCLNNFNPGETMPHGCWIGLADERHSGKSTPPNCKSKKTPAQCQNAKCRWDPKGKACNSPPGGANLGNANNGDRFRWVDKSPMNYAKWAPGEPNDSGTHGEDVVELDMRGGLTKKTGRTGGWNDCPQQGEGGRGKYPICETRKPKMSTVAGVASLNGKKPNPVQRYVGVAQKMKWADARAYCQSNYLDLASIHDKASNDYIGQLCLQQLAALGGMQNGGGACWVGANDIGTEKTFVWSDGSSIDFTDWHKGEPNNVKSTSSKFVTKDEDVVEYRLVAGGLQGRGAWNDNRDDRLYPFICEEAVNKKTNGGNGH